MKIGKHVATNSCVTLALLVAIDNVTPNKAIKYTNPIERIQYFVLKNGSKMRIREIPTRKLGKFKVKKVRLKILK